MEQLSEEYPVEKRSVCVVVFSSPDKMVVTAAGSIEQNTQRQQCEDDQQFLQCYALTQNIGLVLMSYIYTFDQRDYKNKSQRLTGRVSLLSLTARGDLTS